MKDKQKSLEYIAQSNGCLLAARIFINKAHKEIGERSPWKMELSKCYASLHQCILGLEEIYDQIHLLKEK